MVKIIFDKYKSLPVQVKASLWFLICSFLQRGISMITTPIFTRLMTTAEYGQFSVFSSWMGIATPIITLNLSAGVYSQGLVKFNADRDRFTSSLQGLELTLILVWFVIYSLTSPLWNGMFSLSTIQMYSMFILIWTGKVFGFWSMDQKVDFKYRKLLAITMTTSLLQPVIGIILVYTWSDKVTARIVSSVVMHLPYIVFFIIQMKKGKCYCSKYYWKYALRFNIPLLPHYLSMTILSSSDRIMINNMVGASEAGIYSLAYSLSMVMTMFNNALLQTIEPWIYRKLKEKKAREVSKVAYPCFILIAGLNLALIAFAPEVVAIFAPPAYQEAIWVIPSVALSVFFTFLYTFFATFEFYYEKTKFIAAATVGGAVLNIVLNYIFIQIFGYMAAGYTTLFSYMLYAGLHYYFMRRVCKENLDNLKPYSLKLILAIAAGSLVVGFSLMATYSYPIIRYGLIGLALFLCLIFRNRLLAVAKMLVSVKKQKSGSAIT